MKSYRILVVLAVLAMSAVSIVAQTVNEVLYIADTMGDTDGWSSIYKVEISGTAANLVLIPNGMLPYNHADVIAADPDGSKIWFIDDFTGGASDSGKLCWYETADATVHEVGVVTLGGTRMVEIDQAAISPSGTMYIANNLTDSIYTIDKSTAVATLVGPVLTTAGGRVDIQGADIAFAADGTMYLWINWALGGAPQGLYTLQLPAGGSGSVIATWVGGEQEAARRFTGLAIRANGIGDLVGSITAGAYSNTIAIVDKTTGLFTEVFPMYAGGERFNHTWGDMSIGPFPKPPTTNEPPETNITFCTYTIGYWKNHAWNGAVVTILGVTVDETLGKTILKKATSKNMSMLFAQMIAAKLNVNNASGIEVIDAAEDYLVELDDATANIVIYDKYGNPVLNWNRPHSSKTEKALTTYWSEALDVFNNAYHCED